jgi:hypothetical protein
MGSEWSLRVADWQYGPMDGNYHGGKEEGEE